MYAPSFYIVINTKNTSGPALRYQRSCAPLLAGAAPCMALGRLHDDYVIAIFSVCFSCRHWGELGTSVSEAPSCGLNGRAVTISIEDMLYRRPYVHRYCACAALRANVAGQIGNRFSPAESAFSACIGSGSSQTS